MPFRVAVIARARRDIEEIHLWLLRRSEQGAASWIDAAERSIKRLESEALDFPLIPQHKRLKTPVRSFPFHTRRGQVYQLYYEVDESRGEVRVLRVRGPGQRPIRSSDFA